MPYTRQGPAVRRSTPMSVTTFLFTDLVGSTELLSRVGEVQMEAIRRAHFTLLREAVDATDGREVKNLGDGLMVVFASPSDAVSCSVAMQRAVDRNNRRSGSDVAIRVGIDLGETTEEGGDFFGGPVVVAKRLCDTAGGGEILVSDLVRALAAPHSAYRFDAVGAVALKGLPQSVPAFTVAWTSTECEPLPLPPMVTAYVEDRLPFIGRRSEWAVLERSWERARHGRCQLLCIGGEPGIGKTRLACEFARDAWAHGAVVLAGRSSEDLTLPYQPFIEALRHHVMETPAELLREETEGLAEILAKLIPELHERLPGVEPIAGEETEVERFRLFEALAAFICEISSRAPALLILDDLQWADQASLLLLKHLVRSPRPSSVVVLATYRESDVPRSHPLAHVLEDLHRDQLERRLILRGLQRGDVGEFVEAFLGEGCRETLADVLADQTDGNPLFIEEIMRDLRDTGVGSAAGTAMPGLRTGCGRVDVEHWGVPAGVKEVLWQRLRRLSPDALEALRIASVIGVEFGLDVLKSMLDTDEDALVPLLDEAVHASLITEAPPSLGRYAFAHGLIRHALYDEHTLNGRARLHARVAATIEHLHPHETRLPAAELAYHYSRSGPRWSTKVLTYALAAGEEAMSLLAYEDAEIEFATALRALDDTRQHGDRERARALIGLAAARRAEGDPVASRASCLQAAELARRAGDSDLFARAAIGLALPGAGIGMDFGVVDHERIHLLEEALAALPPDASETRLRTIVHLVLSMHLSPHLDRRLAAAAEAVRVADQLGRPELRAAALAARHSTEWGRTAIQDRIATSRSMALLAMEGGAPQTALEGHIALAIDLLEAADVDGMAAGSTAIRAFAKELRQPFYQWYSCVLDATRAALEGRYTDGERCIAESLACTDGALGRRPEWGKVAYSFVTGWDRGTLSAVEDPLRQLRDAFPDALVLDGALAHLLCESGRIEEGAEVARRLLDDPTCVPEDAMWLFTLALVGEVCWHVRDRAAASALADLLAPVAGRLVVVGSGVGCCGAVDRTLGLVALTAGRLEPALAHLHNALTMHERIGARPWSARTKGALAAALLDRGEADDRTRAQHLLSEARTEAEHLGANGLRSWLDGVGGSAKGQVSGRMHG